jgi:hypothetical protein
MMAKTKIDKAMEDVYAALDADNEGLEDQIRALRDVLREAGEKTATFDTSRLPNNTRQGRKMMQTYFKKRGVLVEFDKTKEEAEKQKAAG